MITWDNASNIFSGVSSGIWILTFLVIGEGTELHSHKKTLLLTDSFARRNQWTMCSNRQEGKKPTQVPCELTKWGLESRSPNFHLNILSLIWSLVISSILSLSPIDGGWGQRWKFQLQSLVTLRVQPLLSYWYLILSRHLLGASLVAQMVKNLPAMQEIQVQSLCQEYPWRRGWLPIPVFLPGEFSGQRSLASYSLWGHKELNTTERLIHMRVHTQTLTMCW